MRWNSARVVKLYSRPFSSDPRGGRVVHEMEKSTPLTCLRSSLTRVLLPEPEGAEMIKSIPANLIVPFVFLWTLLQLLFHVLNLFARFFDFSFHRQSQLGNPNSLS